MTKQEFLDSLTTQQLESVFYAYMDDFEQFSKPLPLSYLSGCLQLDITGLLPEDCPTLDDISNSLFDRAHIDEDVINHTLAEQRPVRTTCKKRRVLLSQRPARVAVVALLLTLLIACAFAVVFNATTHVFGANGGSLDYMQSGVLSIPDARATFSNISDALEAENINVGAPKWVPYRFALDDVEVLDNKSGTFVSAWFTSGDDDSLSILYLFPSENYSASIESDNNLNQTLGNEPVSRKDENIEIFVYNEVSHIITNNMDIPIAEWFYNGVIISVSGDVTNIELKQIIKSTYEVVK